MDLSDKHTSTRLVIDAPPEALYDIVADLTRMGELSPVCTGGFYDDDGKRGAGAWFTGRNERDGRRWETRCHITTADRPREISWEMCGGRLLPPVDEAQPDDAHEAEEPVSRWTYRFRVVDGGTEVEEEWRLLREREHMSAMDDEAQRQMVDGMRAQMRDTLAALARVAAKA